MMYGKQTIDTRSRCVGFTLIELLVIILIITVLIGILLPTLGKARRAALVLACPIVYVAEDSHVYLTDPHGVHHMLVSDAPCTNYVGAMWSPACDRLSYQSDGDTVVVDPISGRADRFSFDVADWFDEHRLLSLTGYPGPSNAWLLDLDSGTKSLYKRAAEAGFPPGGGHIYKEPHIIGGYVAALADGYWAPTLDVFLLDLKMRPVKTIWQDPNNDWDDMFPLPDPTGQWIGWTRVRSPNGVSRPRSVAIKAVNAPPSQPPRILGDSFKNAVFCDWFDEQSFLAIVMHSDNSSHLVVMDMQGQVLHEIPTPYGLCYNQTNNPTYARMRRARRY